MKVGIFMADSNGGYPVPASKGGAVSTLVEHLVEENDKEQCFDMDIISIYDPKAEKMSRRYSNINFIWIKPPKIIAFFDKLFFDIVRTFFKGIKATSYKSLFSLFYCILASSKIIKRNEYDKVILENNVPLAWCIKFAKYKGDYYYHFHNVPRVNAKCRKVFQGCKEILCVSQYVANEIASENNPIGPIPAENLKVLYNCINTEQFRPLNNEKERQNIRDNYGISKNQKVICFVGRLSEEKGIDKVLKAVIQLDRKDIKVLIVGSYIHNDTVIDDYQKRLYKLAEDLRGNIIFTGYIPQDKIQEIYQISDVAVLPSMWNEPAGLTMVEALACGIPVITTNSGGIPEYMQGNAIVLERNENLVSEIANNISRVLANKNVDTEIQKKGLEEFCKKNYYINFKKLIGV